VPYRELADEADAHYLVARVIDRRDLHLPSTGSEPDQQGRHSLVCLPTRKMCETWLCANHAVMVAPAVGID
jgi:hypothetical protein